MSAASDLIERAEEEGVARCDDPSSNTVAILMGALSRELGQHKFGERDDLAVGLLIQDEIANGEQRRQEKALLASLLSAGLSPDDIQKLTR
jgi:hypothetical protein